MAEGTRWSARRFACFVVKTRVPVISLHCATQMAATSLCKAIAQKPPGAKESRKHRKTLVRRQNIRGISVRPSPLEINIEGVYFLLLRLGSYGFSSSCSASYRRLTAIPCVFSNNASSTQPLDAATLLPASMLPVAKA